MSVGNVLGLGRCRGYDSTALIATCIIIIYYLCVWQDFPWGFGATLVLPIKNNCSHHTVANMALLPKTGLIFVIFNVFDKLSYVFRVSATHLRQGTAQLRKQYGEDAWFSFWNWKG